MPPIWNPGKVLLDSGATGRIALKLPQHERWCLGSAASSGRGGGCGPQAGASSHEAWHRQEPRCDAAVWPAALKQLRAVESQM